MSAGFFERLREAEDILRVVAEASDRLVEPAKNGAAVLDAIQRGDEEALRRRVQPTVERVMGAQRELDALRERIRSFLADGGRSS